ncbi:hypothetical protein SLEP1_g32991 [Rubroshorea leprosula]|uniref:NB-ARC domain-containing protein n=1 Tax=Rubroshorea leprosula TaxID=152421 RepID=A0AAV5KF87_9ROSI|nr:hypothetical protein SLEP1_g32991 [Rubroshorea leprosula]
MSCFSIRRVCIRRKIALNIKEINQRIDDIVKEKEKYQLLSMSISNTINHPQQRPETSSFVDLSKLCGRDKEKAYMLNYLWGGSGEEEVGEVIPTISIVGMGGLGKTALAQLICNDNEVKKHFDRVIWVCVSDLFNENKVARAIIQALEKLGDNAAYGLELNPLQFLLERISSSIQGMKYFLVLDDVWDAKNGERWEGLKAAFKFGAPGSRILVTTRDVEVAKMMGSSFSQIISLEKLGDEQCWSIIKRIALEGREDQNLEKIGRAIARKCKGLPLAAKTLGSLLKTKTNVQEWQSVLNSEIWVLEMAQKDIFAPLLLSYFDLPPPVKQCFLYCVLFPKDHEIWHHVIIPQWMAMGYLGSDRNSELESKGEEYFRILVARSFFQDLVMDDEKIIYCKMHDMVHEFAQFLAENEFRTLEIKADHLTRDDGSKLHHLLRHMTVMVDKGINFPTMISDAEKLRALITFTGVGALTSEALCSLFNRCRRLRLLSVGWPDGTDHLCKEIPEEIEKLMHLRFLHLPWSNQLEGLPEALCNLLNLEYLDLTGCQNLKQLPDSIGKLINLRFLFTNACLALTHYPKGVRKLTSLRQLRGLIARADRNDAKAFSLVDLENLKHLHVLHLKVAPSILLNTKVECFLMWDAAYFPKELDVLVARVIACHHLTKADLIAEIACGLIWIIGSTGESSSMPVGLAAAAATSVAATAAAVVVARLLVTVSKDDTVTLDGAGDKKSIEERREQSAIELSTSDYDKEKLQEILAKLSGGVAVLKIGGASETEVGEKKDRVTDALNATKASVEEGGGVALLYGTEELDKLPTDNFDQKIGVQIIQNALKTPVYTIASNAGVEGAVVVGKLLEQDNPDLGYDAAKGEYVDMVKAGLIDPLKVIRTALVDAASLQAIVSELPKDEKETPAMGGMGGMDY